MVDNVMDVNEVIDLAKRSKNLASSLHLILKQVILYVISYTCLW